MQLYVTERHIPGMTAEELASAIERAKVATAEMTREGTPVRYLRSTLVPGDDRIACLFEGPSPEAVMEANNRADIPFDRVLEAMAMTAQDVGQRQAFSSIAERPDFRPLLREVDTAAYPAFMLHTDLEPLWDVVYDEFPEYQLVLHDELTDMHLAHGNMVPFVWDGTYEGLPKTAADMVNLALDNKRSGARPTTLGALQAVVNPSQQGGGLSSRMLQGMANLSATRGFPDLFAPIRPNQKEKYPLIPLENYVTWTRPDGFPTDAWQRVHIRLGATPAGVIHGWMTVTATVKEWELWTGLSLPQSGQYVVRGGLVPVEIDTEQDIGRYVEPHVWMHYRITPVADAVEQAPLLVEAAGPVEIAVGAPPVLVGQLRPVGGSMGMRIVIPRSRPLRIGHDDGNELQLFDEDVAPFHARVDYIDGAYTITDLDTRPGTYVNGHRIPSRPERTTLHDGEEIRLGASATVSFVFELRPVAASSPTAAPVTA